MERRRETKHNALMAGGAALVTGAGGGVGKATAVGLAAIGAEVAVTGRNREHREQAAREIRAAGARVDVFIGTS